ncbi:fatty-acid amide hydrolase 2 [Bemisia tabaci]
MEFAMHIYGFILKVLSFMITPILAVRAFFVHQKPLPPIKSEYIKCSASELARKIRKQEVTCERIVRAFIVRCREVNPVLNAISENRFCNAIDEAHTIDQMIDSGVKTEEELERDTPLLGVPFTVKESCGLKGMRFSVGCTLRDGMKAMENGAAVEKLVKAGAIPILVSNTPELCCSIETYNFITGRTNNPYNRFRTSGGSSGGEAALLGSGASVIGIGSDMGGSIRVPAMFNGVYGHKPTPGIIDLTGHFPLDPSPDFQKVLCIGPMTRYAEDLTPMFKILAGDKASSLNLDHKVPVNNLNVFYLDNCGYPLGNNQPTREIKKKIHQAVNHFKSKSCKCEKADLPEWDDSTEISLASFFGSILKSVNKTLNNMSIKFSLPHEAVKFILGAPTFTLATIHFTALLTFKAFIPKKRREMYVVEAETLKKKLTNLLKDNGVLLCPTSAQPAFYHGLFPLKQTLTCQAFLFNILHLPATNVPLGLNSQGLPIGLQVVAGPGQDKLCFQVAEELEAAFGGWVPPPSSY